MRFDHQLKLNNLDQRTLMDVLTVTEAAPGVWLPTRATATLPALGKPAGTLVRFDFACDAARANEPPATDDAFRVTIPSGYTVTDTRGGKRREYVLWSDGTEHDLVEGKPFPTEPAQQRRR